MARPPRNRHVPPPHRNLGAADDHVGQTRFNEEICALLRELTKAIERIEAHIAQN